MESTNHHNQENPYQDKVLTCHDCGSTFVWTSGEQRFYLSKNPPLAPPKRCSICRDRRKRTINPGMAWDDAVQRANVAYDTAHNNPHEGVRQ